MDPGRPKPPSSTEMPTPGQPGLETVVRSHSAQLTKLNTELTSAFAQVTGEMGAFRAASASTSTALSSLSSQVAALTDLVTSLLPARAPEPNPSPPAVPPAAPTEPPLDPRWEPSLPPPKPYAGEFDRCRGFLGQCELLFCHQSSRFRSDGARVALIMSSLTDRALDWAVAAVGRDPRMSSDLPLFLEEFRRVFDHPTSGADSAGRLHSIKQGGRSIADYTLEFRTLAADSGWDDVALRSAYRRGLSEEIKDLLVRDRPTSLNDLAYLAYQMDERLRERRLERAQRTISAVRMPSVRSGTSPSRPQGPTPAPVLSSTGAGLSRTIEEEEPMQLGRSRLSPEVREQRFRERLCLYCGGNGHLIRSCPVRPNDPAR